MEILLSSWIAIKNSFVAFGIAAVDGPQGEPLGQVRLEPREVARGMHPAEDLPHVTRGRRPVGEGAAHGFLHLLYPVAPGEAQDLPEVNRRDGSHGLFKSIEELLSVLKSRQEFTLHLGKWDGLSPAFYFPVVSFIDDDPALFLRELVACH